MEIKEMSPAGLEFLINNEGIILHPYKDSVGVWTIGVGSTYYEDGTRVKENDRAITRERAMELFKNTLKHYELTVWSNTIDTINQNQFDALVSFTYNVGVNGFKNSTLLRRINNGASPMLIRLAFLLWNKPPEIKKRRRREVELYFK